MTAYRYQNFKHIDIKVLNASEYFDEIRAYIALNTFAINNLYVVRNEKLHNLRQLAIAIPCAAEDKLFRNSRRIASKSDHPCRHNTQR